MKMRVDEFSIGFGPAIYSKKKGETLYSLRMIPLGGFNKIAGMTVTETQEENVPRDRAFVYKSALAKGIVISAGAIMNFVLAGILFIAFFFTQGIAEPNEDSVVGNVLPSTPAAQVNLKAGDKITQIGNHPITKWIEISEVLQEFSDKTVPIKIMRGKIETEVFIRPVINEQKRAVIGITPEVRLREVGMREAMVLSTQKVAFTLEEMAKGIWEILTGKALVSNLAGPVGIAHLAGDVAATGIWNLVWFTGVLSLNLGLINLLPIPVLDGGHLIIILIEGITKKKLPDKAIYYVQMIGIVLLGSVFLWTTGNDIIKMFR